MGASGTDPYSRGSGASSAATIRVILASDSPGATGDATLAEQQLQTALLTLIRTALDNVKIDADSVNLNTDGIEALIGTGNTSLASILAKIIAAPATEAKQDTGNTSLASIATNTGTVPSAGTGAFGLSSFRAPTSAPLTNAAQVIKAGAGNVYGVRVQSPAANVITTYLKFFNVAAASVIVGTTVPVLVLAVPAYSSPDTGQLLIIPGPLPIQNFGTAISVLATSVLSDTGAQTAPSAGVIAEIQFA